MTKTLIDVDDDLLRRVSAVLGTATKKDTVNAALAEVLALQERRVALDSLVQWTADHEPLDSKAHKRAWRQ